MFTQPIFKGKNILSYLASLILSLYACVCTNLEPLSVEHFLLQLLDGLARLDERLRHLPVAAPVAGGDEVGHAAALEESVRLRAGVKMLGVRNHLHQPEPVQNKTKYMMILPN